jgi:hypothetical protein
MVILRSKSGQGYQAPILKIKHKTKGSMTRVVEQLPGSMHAALGSIPSTAKERKNMLKWLILCYVCFITNKKKKICPGGSLGGVMGNTIPGPWWVSTHCVDLLGWEGEQSSLVHSFNHFFR